MRDVGGVFVPWQIERSIGIGSGETRHSMQTTFDVVDCQLGHVADTVFLASFTDEKGVMTMVNDYQKEGVAYNVKDGIKRAVPLLNPNGNVTGGEPTTGPATQPLGKD